MSATLNGTDSQVAAPTLKAAVLYDEYHSGCRAKAFFDQLTTRFNGEVQFSLALWRMDVLHLPGAASAALRDVGCADMLVMAMGAATNLPPSVLDWVESWANCRAYGDSALVLLWAAGEKSAAPPASLSQLQQMAGRRGLSFFDEWGEPGRKSEAYVEHLRLHEQAITPTFQRIMDYSDRGSQRDWGPND